MGRSSIKGSKVERLPTVFSAQLMKDGSSKKAIVNRGGNDNSEVGQRVA